MEWTKSLTVEIETEEREDIEEKEQDDYSSASNDE